MLALAARRDAKIGDGVWSLNVEPLNFELPCGFERSEAVERLEQLERTDPHLELSKAVERLERLEQADPVGSC